MLCHQHPADAAHAACQRCQRGLCRSCTKQFLQRLCTQCIEHAASKRVRAARRTLWLTPALFVLPAWLVSQVAQPYWALLAGMASLGIGMGVRRWRRAPSLTGGIASMPESETPLRERVLVPALAGIVFWPWLLVETVRDLQLAKRLRAFVPAAQRTRTFGVGEASLALLSVLAVFGLGTHALGRSSPVARELPAQEEALAPRAHAELRNQLTAPPAAQAIPAEARPGAAARTRQAPASSAERDDPQRSASSAMRVDPAPSAVRLEATPAAGPAEAARAADEPIRQEAASNRHARRRAQDEAATQAEHTTLAAEPELPAPESPAVEAPASEAPQAPLDRRFVPGSEMAKQAQSGKRAPDGSYVTSSGRLVIKAPPPSE